MKDKTYYFVGFYDYETNRFSHFGELGEENVLWDGTPTLFEHRHQAVNAIKRTETYARKNNLQWSDWWYGKVIKATVHNKRI